MNLSHRLLTQVLLTFMLALPLLGGALNVSGEELSAQAPVHDHAHPPAEATYVCPMHPQVVSAEPGSRCPICGMDLVAVQAEQPAASPTAATSAPGQAMEMAMEMPTIAVPEAVINQLGVRTAVVRQGTLPRTVEGFGVLLSRNVRSYRPIARSRAAQNAAREADAEGQAMLIQAQVFEGQAALLQPGQVVRVRFPSLGAREWRGLVDVLESQINLSSHTLQFRVSIDLEGVEIPGGTTAVVNVEVDPEPDVLLVPREAVIFTGKGARVILARDGGRFQPRPVAIDDLGEDEMIIRSGLQEGDRVVVSAQFLLDSEANLRAGLRRLSSERPHTEAAPGGTQP
ncbi:MAG: efflux RND transporter periplasmic adaptor subunit [Chromatiaceae bacterium]|nr:efflux RND transporter periplasmic adaptor subunit [Chromatiaceae bacterium]